MRLVLVCTLLTLAGCGYVGDPLPPASNFPANVTDLTVKQTGDALEARFTLPKLTLEGLPVKAGEMELRIGPNTGPPFVTADWMAKTRPVTLAWPKAGELAVSHRLQAADYAGQDLVFGVRMANPKGRFGGWSNLVAIQVVPPVAMPASLRLTEVAEGVRLDWTAPARPDVEFRVYKKEMGQKDPAPVLVATVPKPEFVDENIVYGRTYEYSVQAALGAAAESVRTETLSVTPKDTFPPAVPSGLTAIQGAQSIEVAWDRSTDFDFARYRVYRALDDGDFTRVAETGANPSYSDRQLQAGKRHRYAVTAVDERGNESGRSAAVEVVP